jgi:hypothetical protein
MKIKDGGHTSNIQGTVIETITVVALEGNQFELWINDSLSYLTINEMLQLKYEIQKELEKSIK